MTRRRRSLIFLPVLTLELTSGIAAAADPDGCPPEEWFCDEGEAPAAPPPSEPGSTEVPAEPAPPEERKAGSASWTSDDPTGDTPNIDLNVGKSTDRGSSSEQLSRSSRWSVNLRVQGVMLGGRGDRHGDSGMGGVGVSMRYWVSDLLTLDIGLDSLLGTDYYGYDRSELTVSLSGLLYFSRHPSVSTYALFGFNSSAATVDINGSDQEWNYVGAHTGLGLQVPVSRRAALDFDLIGFVRGRADTRAAVEPEFTDGFGRVSNTSGGGLFRAGLSLFW